MTRAKYTLEFKLEAVGLAGTGQSIAATEKMLGLAEQTLHNWIKAEKQGRLPPRQLAPKKKASATSMKALNSTQYTLPAPQSESKQHLTSV